MQRIVIVPSILAQLNASNSEVKRLECLSLLNRLGSLVQEAGGLQLISSMLEESQVDR